MRDPTAKSEKSEMESLAPRIKKLKNKKIGFHINTKEAAEPVARIVEEKLDKKHSSMTFSRCTVPARDEEGLDRIEEWAGELNACIAVVGDCGGCTRAVVRAANAVEESGTPAVGLVAEGFEMSWETNAVDQQRHIRNQTLSIRSETTDPELLQEEISAETVRGIENALIEPLTDEEKGLEERNLFS